MKKLMVVLAVAALAASTWLWILHVRDEARLEAEKAAEKAAQVEKEERMNMRVTFVAVAVAAVSSALFAQGVFRVDSWRNISIEESIRTAPTYRLQDVISTRENVSLSESCPTSKLYVVGSAQANEERTMLTNIVATICFCLVTNAIDDAVQPVLPWGQGVIYTTHLTVTDNLGAQWQGLDWSGRSTKTVTTVVSEQGWIEFDYGDEHWRTMFKSREISRQVTTYRKKEEWEEVQ